MVPVTLLTASLPERVSMLADMLASVALQTVRPSGHYLSVDWPEYDNLTQLNGLAECVDTTWMSPIADDDLLKPWFLEQMYAATHNADVVYGYADMSNWPPDAPQLELINAPFDAVRLRETNWIPGGCTLIRTELFRKVGGYPADMPDVTHAGDWYLWHRLLDVGARFVCVPEVTWFYRHHQGQKEAHARV